MPKVTLPKQQLATQVKSHSTVAVESSTEKLQKSLTKLKEGTNKSKISTQIYFGGSNDSCKKELNGSKKRIGNKITEYVSICRDLKSQNDTRNNFDKKKKFIATTGCNTAKHSDGKSRFNFSKEGDSEIKVIVDLNNNSGIPSNTSNPNPSAHIRIHDIKTSSDHASNTMIAKR